jgi:hypothetical protein
MATPDFVRVRYDDGETKDIELDNNRPLNRKSFRHQTPAVQPGQQFGPGDLLAHSNYTDDKGVMALGANFRTAYMPFRGLNHEDAIVISESASKRLTSEQAYQHTLDRQDDMTFNKDAYQAAYPHRFSEGLMSRLDEDGVVKPGQTVEFGDPLSVVLQQTADTGGVMRGKRKLTRDSSLTWDHETPGVITDVAKTKDGINIVVKSMMPMQTGDKLAPRYGDKGVVHIVKDDDMPRGQDGKPIEIIVSDLGVLGRANPAQVAEALLGKIARKTGKPINVPDFKDIEDLTEWANEQARMHGISAEEDLIDPRDDRKIPQVLTGERFFMKLHHQSECYDEQTEVLSRRGWLPWAKVTAADELATVDGNQLLYERPLELVRKRFRGQLCCFAGSYIDYAVTPNHRMYMSSYNWQQEWGFREAAAVHGTRFRVRQHGFTPDAGEKRKFITIGGKKIAWDDYAELVGWWASEGYARVTSRRSFVTIYQSSQANGHNVTRLVDLANRLGWPWHYYTVSGEIYGISISSPDLARHLKQYGTHSHNKRLPRTVLSGPLSGRLRTFDAMMRGDGTQTEYMADKVVARYSTTSKRLADDFQELCLRIGLGASVRPCAPRKETHYLPAWHCGVAMQRTTAQVDGDRNKHQFSMQDYSGMVYCATMRTGLLYVRRNGKPMLCGNSKGQGRGTGGYTAEERPSKGGEEGSKTIGLLQSNAIMSHGVTGLLRDAATVRGQANPEYWMAIRQGIAPPKPKVPFTYERFINELAASGINTVSDGDQMHIMALTDKDIDERAGTREIQRNDLVRLDDKLSPVTGGLFDQSLTGGHGGSHWAKITLPEPMPNPVMEEPIRRVLNLTQNKFRDVLAGRESTAYGTGPQAIFKALDAIDIPKELTRVRETLKTGRKSARDLAERQLGYLKTAERVGQHPREWMLNSIPVLPPRFRPISLMQHNDQPLVSDINYLYREAIDARDNLKAMSGQIDDVGDERLGLYDAFRAITGMADPQHPKLVEKQVGGVLGRIFGKGSSKYGTLQRKLLSRQVDLVGRGVIVPNPDLDMDSVGLPERRVWPLYGEFVTRRLRRRGFPLVRAMQEVENRTPLAREELLREMQTRPVFVDRAPVLHRFGTMAFYPKLVVGNSIHVSPAVLTGFAADFDGDTMQYHVPADDSAIPEILDRMLPSKNLLSPADFKSPTYVAGKEFIGGLFKATQAANAKARTVRFLSRKDALAAARRGDMALDTPIEVDD